VNSGSEDREGTFHARRLWHLQWWCIISNCTCPGLLATSKASVD